MPRFEPIAIIGRACLLPGANSPQALWETVLASRVALQSTPEGYWRVDPELVRAPSPAQAEDRTWCDRGGYVAGFEDLFDPGGFALPAERIERLDPLCQWSLHVTREALREAGLARGDTATDRARPAPRTGVILGNLSYPSQSLSRFAEAVWLDEQPDAFFRERGAASAGIVRPEAENRYMSGLPALLAARALGLEGPAFCLDAACASALYAIRLACDVLARREADVMVAGGLNRADDLFIHVGFCALAAMSKSGRSRPFHAEADGLVPAEGAAAVALCRLDDAVAQGLPIHGVLRAVGLSNDGADKGLLVPAESGQRRAMEAAFAQSGLDGSSVQLLEAHATGTPVGDVVEVRSTAEVYRTRERGEPLALGALKANLGHSITVSGAAGLLEVLSALEQQCLPPTPVVEAPLPELEQANLALRHQARPWAAPKDGSPRRAAVSSFGFGGNNAHLLVEEYAARPAQVAVAQPSRSKEPIAIVDIEALIGSGRDTDDLRRALFAEQASLRGQAGATPRGDEIELPLTGLRFSPADLDQTLAQQITLLRAALALVARHPELPHAETGVLIGMQADAEVGRYGARWRIADWARSWARDCGVDAADLEAGWLERAKEQVGALRKAAGVVGAMPNIPANRLCAQLDLRGPSFTISAEEASGLAALSLAVEALRSGELACALVGGVDLCAEPVHQAAAREVFGADDPRAKGGDAALLLLLEPLSAARAAGREVLAVIDDSPEANAAAPALTLRADGEHALLDGRFGYPHAASGLLQVAAAALCCAHRSRPATAGDAAHPALPLLDEHCRVATEIEVLEGGRRSVTLAAVDAPRPLWPDRPLELAPDSERGPALGGELAFVYTGPAGAYPQMGAELLAAFPWLLEDLESEQRACIGEAGGWIVDPTRSARGVIAPEEKLWGSTLLSQLHTLVARELLGLQPQAALGLSAGESNALHCLGAWGDMAQMYRELRDEGVFPRAIAGELSVPKRAWVAAGLLDEAAAGEARWAGLRVLAPLEALREALADEPLCHLTIVHADGDALIAGEASAVERVGAKVGKSRCTPLGYDVAIHCPELEGYLETWYRLHHRKTHPTPGLRFYAAGFGEAYTPTAERAAEAICAMATRTVDWPQLIERAYADGVRAFVELGPRDGCTRWIGRILGERPHVAVALDRSGKRPLEQLFEAATTLAGAGVELDLDRLRAGIERSRAGSRYPSWQIDGPTRRYPAHPDPLVLPPLVEPRPEQLGATLPAAPALPPVQTSEQIAAVVGHGAAAEPVAPIANEDNSSAVGQDPLVAAALAQHQQLAWAHQHYLAEQHRVESAFLQLRAQSLGALAGSPSIGAVGPAPAAPIVAPEPAPAAPIVAPEPDTSAPPSIGAAEPAPAAPTNTGASSVYWDRDQLATLASDKISTVFGELFAIQDDFPRQVRLPEPPLLLADRVTGLEAPAGSMTKGTIWTETDVRRDSWYLSDTLEMPAGVMVESGQSDLLLISWLGADFLNRGERVYRLLGCELSYRGGLPRPGDTLVYDIHVDGHAKAGDTRLFFFHYDCRVDGEVRLSVRNGQAGFFTDEELAGSGGVLWSPEDSLAELDPAARVDPPKLRCSRTSFSAAQVRALSEGRVTECFGPGYEPALSHTRTPKIQSGPMMLLEQVSAFEPQGGPWGRGYLRVENDLSGDEWYLQGHFKNDPCMPGTLMCEGCVQAMVFFLVGCGYTLDKDGWRFEPLPDETYDLRCRGQVTPDARKLVYEVFVEELHDGPEPTIIADILGSADGLKIFHGKRMALRLVPDWPLSSRPELLEPIAEREGSQQVAELDGFRFGYASLLACAWGRPSDAFGDLGAAFDGTRHIARLPGPPYHFMSRVAELKGPDGGEAQMGGMQVGTSVALEYDIPPEAWYFEQSNVEAMPFAVLLEAALQPCGWLAVFVGGPARSEIDLFFRNLDGTGTIHRELTPDSGTLHTRTTLKSISKVGPMTLVSFELTCRLADGSLVYELSTGFGFFPKEALAQQVGLPVNDEQRAALLEATSDFHVDLTTRPARYCEGTPRLPGPMLLMLDAVTGYWPEGGPAGLGRLRSEKRVDPAEWFFKAHFFQDPVQPGSLGIEAMVQLLQFYMLEEGLAEGIDEPRFEPLSNGRSMTWSYRGQVTPEKGVIRVELNIVARGHDDDGAAYATAEAWLWVDELRIYSAKDLTVRIVSDAATGRPLRPLPAPSREERVDLATQPWIADHRPNYTRPVLPMASLLDRCAGAALDYVSQRYAPSPSWEVSEVRDLALAGWAIVDAPLTLRSTIVERAANASDTRIDHVELEVTLEQRPGDPAGQKQPDDEAGYQPLCKARVICARQHSQAPPPWTAPADVTADADPYQSGALFHGPSLQQLRQLRTGATGSSALLDPAAALAAGVPLGTLHQALLDAALHGIPHDNLDRWAPSADPERLGYPLRIERARFFAPPPTEGRVRCEARFISLEAAGQLARFELQLIVGSGERDPALRDGFRDEQVWAELTLLEALMPMGRQGRDRHARLTFLRDRQFIAGVGLSQMNDSSTCLTEAEVRLKDWLPGSVAAAYGLDPERPWELAELTAQVALRDHLAQRAQVHPSQIAVLARPEPGEDWTTISARSPALPLSTLRAEARRVGQQVEVRDVPGSAPENLAVAQDLAPLLEAGRQRLALQPWVGEEVTAALFERFVRRVYLADPAAFAEQVVGRPALYLGNHQIQVESILITLLTAALSQTHVVTIAKAEHERGWVGQLIRALHSYPGLDAAETITYFDQQDRRSMFSILEQLGRGVRDHGHSVFLHPEGELSLRGRQPVERLSSVFIDFALELELPIVPVRFVGGLPIEPLDETCDFPWRYGQQDYWIGRPIAPATLAALPYAERRATILAGINGLGPDLATENAHPPIDAAGQPSFAERVAQRMQRNGDREAAAVVSSALEDYSGLSSAGQLLLRGETTAAESDEERWRQTLSTWLEG
jgi:acyl transferase domain-containing protein/3-hydroxymyristoyl/3-hydroxydecanoyl-(acyl carrier protein) dehydratase/1-acyl-sn-glycerol-3-phosphate acyltransferase